MFYGAVAAAGVVAGYSMVSLAAGELLLHPPKYAWSHGGVFSALDHQRSVCVQYYYFNSFCSQYLHFDCCM